MVPKLFFQGCATADFSISIILIIFLTILLNLLNLPKKKLHQIDYLISLVFISIFLSGF